MTAPDSKDFENAHGFAMRWFEVHADQRLKIMNFFLVIAGFFVGGFFTAFHAKNYIAALVVSLILIVICFSFKQLDNRTRQLIHLGEDILGQTSAKLAERLSMDKLNIISLANSRSQFWSYRKTFNLLYGVFAALGAAGAVNSACELMK